MKSEVLNYNPFHSYNTSSIARLIGIHPNTVRLYEELGLISAPERKANGYRVFTDLHFLQFRVARTALQIEVLQNGLRKKAIDIIKTTARCDFNEALRLTDQYIKQVNCEIMNASEAVRITREIIVNETGQKAETYTRKDTSRLLGISMDTLRNWEMNGLIITKRKQNGYRIYTEEDCRRLKIIRTLRCANYSLSAILRMLTAFDENNSEDISVILNKPKEDEDIISACDKLVISLQNALKNGREIEKLLLKMKEKFNPPL